MWKVLVYGNYLDFNLIYRLKTAYKSIADRISDTETYSFGQGMQIGGGNKMDVSHRIGRRFIDARKDVEAFWINQNENKKWEKQFVHRSRKNQIFKAPLLLILKGFKSDFRCWSAYSESDVLFQDALTSISVHNKEDSKSLKTISGLLYSKLFSYINLQTFSSSGIEREQAHNKEKFSIPFVANSKIEKTVDQLIKLKKRNFSLETLLTEDLNSKVQNLENELDKLVLKAFNFSNQEQDLLNYSNDIIIPMIMRHKGFERIFNPLPSKSKILKDYYNLFLDRFNDTYKRTNQKLIVEIHHTNQIIGLFFKLVPITEKVDSENYVKTDSSKVLQTLSSLGNEKITDRLFIHKDVRGFEKNGFYIVKPNEQRLWHKAISHLDLNEFTDAILTAGQKNTLNVR